MIDLILFASGGSYGTSKETKKNLVARVEDCDWKQCCHRDRGISQSTIRFLRRYHRAFNHSVYKMGNHASFLISPYHILYYCTYGLFLLFTVIYSTWIGWRVTISVNAVIATHFLTTGNFSFAFVMNEFLLILIGISIAIFINLFYNYKGQLREVLRGMRFTESQLQNVLREIAAYLSESESDRGVWQDIGVLENQIQEFIHEAYEYSGNLFPSHSRYYVDYLEMRLSQCRILQSLHAQLQKIRAMPKQAHLISGYILYLTEYIVEMNIPQKQLDRLHQISRDMEREPMPQTREEFEGRAILYHILMDLEEFLHAKQRFVATMDPAVKKIYWGN